MKLDSNVNHLQEVTLSLIKAKACWQMAFAQRIKDGRIPDLFFQFVDQISFESPMTN